MEEVQIQKVEEQKKRRLGHLSKNIVVRTDLNTYLRAVKLRELSGSRSWEEFFIKLLDCYEKHCMKEE